VATHKDGRPWPGDLGSDYSGAGSPEHWSAFTDGLRTNPQGRRRARRMLLGLCLVCVTVLAATILVPTLL
jgi:hypothetical protein